MTGIVHPRRDLIDQHRVPAAVAHHEHLYRQHADIIERRRDGLGDAARLRADRCGHLRGHARDLEDVVTVFVLGHIEAFDGAVAPARRHHRDLALEVDEALEDRWRAADLVPGRDRVRAVADQGLAFAVVPEPPGLEHGRPADRIERRRQIGRSVDPAVRRGRDLQARDEILFDQAVLGGREHNRIRQHRPARGQKGCGLRRHVLELIRDHIDVLDEAIECGGVVVIGERRAPRHVEGRRIRIRRVDVALEAEPRGGERQHAPELAAAQDADCAVRAEHPQGLRVHAPVSSAGRSATLSLCLRRQASSRSASGGSESASTLAASSAALMAPDRPIASVPTGTPGGI